MWFEPWYRLGDDMPRSVKSIVPEDYMLAVNPLPDTEFDTMYQIIEVVNHACAESKNGRLLRPLDILLCFHKLTKKSIAYVILKSMVDYPFFNTETALVGDANNHEFVFMQLPGYSAYASKYWRL